MNSLISIIVPVYNVENYLHRCVDSLLSQSYSELEVILINDGSLDSSPQICDYYRQKDNRIKVIHKTNGGVSSARNRGIMCAAGRYICFVDSDDYVPKDAISHLYSAMKSEAICGLVGGMCGYIEGGKVKNYIYKKKIISREMNCNEFLKYITESGSYSPYAKLYDARILKDNNLLFREDMEIAEDTVFIRNYLKYCKQICLLPEVVYKYNNENPGSLSKKAYSNYCTYYAEKMRSIEELTDVLGIENSMRDKFLTERAVHGMRLCVNHYLKNWNEDNKRKEMISHSIDILSKWLFLTELDKKNKNYNWWNKYKVAIRQKDINLFYYDMIKKYDSRMKINGIKSILFFKLLGKRK